MGSFVNLSGDPSSAYRSARRDVIIFIYKNALRRFTAIRGKVKLFRSDRGTNFVGAIDPLRIDAICVEDTPVK